MRGPAYFVPFVVRGCGQFQPGVRSDAFLMTRFLYFNTNMRRLPRDNFLVPENLAVFLNNSMLTEKVPAAKVLLAV